MNPRFILSKALRRFQTLIEVIIAMALAVMVLSALTFFYQQVETMNTQMDKAQKEIFQMRYLENRLIDVLPKAISNKDSKKDFFFFTVSDNSLLKPGTLSLIFSFDNGISLDKPFSGHVTARLFLNNQNQLILATWPSPNNWDQHIPPILKKEILLDQVDDLSFEFYIAPDKKRAEDKPTNATNTPNQDANPSTKTTQKDAKKTTANKINPQATVQTDGDVSQTPVFEKEIEPEPKGQWVPSWASQYNQLPVMIRIKVTRSFDKEKPLYFAFPLFNSPKTIVYDR